MKKIVLLSALILFLSFSGLAGEQIKVNIILTEQSDPVALCHEARWFYTKQERRTYVIETLKRQAEASQQELMELLREQEQLGLVSELRPLWIVNSISCYATQEVILSLKDRRDILAISQCKEIHGLFDDETTIDDKDNSREIAENLLHVNVDKVWELGFTGQGVLIAIIDTGVSLTHADLQGCFWDGGAEYPNHGYDFYSHDNDPSDTHGHGTHVAGILVGTGTSGTQTGVAPDAELMVLKVFHGEENLTEPTLWVEAMQFALEHGADVLNMSLGQPLPDAEVKLMLRQACDNTLAAGVVASVCAGNTRQIQMLAPVPYNIWSPGDCPPPHLHEDQMVNAGGTSCVICVGAVDNNDALGGFSSEGPSTWAEVSSYNDYPYTANSSTSIGLIRPDVCAPGVNIKSLDYTNNSGYCLKSGTSMATPCVAGTIALMLSKEPELTPAQIDEILERTAIPLSEHKSNDFGSGRIDALAAVNAVDFDDIEETSWEIQVFPNPTHDYFTINYEGMRQVSVFSMDGKLVRQVENPGNVFRIDGLSKGVYVLCIDTYEGLITKKIVKL